MGDRVVERQAGGRQLFRDQPLQLLRGRDLHARRDILGQQFQQKFGHQKS